MPRIGYVPEKFDDFCGTMKIVTDIHHCAAFHYAIKKCALTRKRKRAASPEGIDVESDLSVRPASGFNHA